VQFIVYKVTNLINQKFYIGVHKTCNPNDRYLGSGRAIKAAIKKYGRRNFQKEVLFITNIKDEAYRIERQLTSAYDQASNYNMKLGGVGGFTRENSLKGYANSLALITKEQRSQNGKLGYKNSLAKVDLTEAGRKGGIALRGKSKSPEHIAAIKAAWVKKKTQ
jgi:hypothetical protein